MDENKFTASPDIFTAEMRKRKSVKQPIITSAADDEHKTDV